MAIGEAEEYFQNHLKKSNLTEEEHEELVGIYHKLCDLSTQVEKWTYNDAGEIIFEEYHKNSDLYRVIWGIHKARGFIEKVICWVPGDLYEED